MIGVIKHISNWDVASSYPLGWQSLRQRIGDVLAGKP